MSLRKQLADLTTEPPSRKPPTLAELEKLARERRLFMRKLARGRGSVMGSFLRGMSPLHRRRLSPGPMFIRDDATAIAFDWYMVGQDMWAAVGQFENSAEYKQAMERRSREHPTSPTPAVGEPSQLEGRVMPVGDAARIHRFCRGEVALARQDGDPELSIHVGSIRDALGLDYAAAALDICNVLETQKFAREARVEYLGRSGPATGLETVYRFRVL